MNVQIHHLELIDELSKVQAHCTKKLLYVLVRLAGDPGGLRDVGANLGLRDADAELGLLPLLHLGQVELQEVPQLVGHDPYLLVSHGRVEAGLELTRPGMEGGERMRYLRIRR